MREHTRLARAGAGEHTEVPGRIGDRPGLFRVQAAEQPGGGRIGLAVGSLGHGRVGLHAPDRTSGSRQLRRVDSYAPEMGYDEKLLYGDEQIVVDTHPSWIMMIRSVLYVLGATVVGIVLLNLGGDGWFGSATNYIAVLLIVLALLHLAQRFVKWYSTNFVITTERCIYREGIVSKRGIEIPLDRINTIFFHQRLFERLFGAGTLHIESAGEMGIQKFKDVRDPMAVQNTLYQAMEDNQTRSYQRMGASAAGAVAPQPEAAPSVADELAKLASLHEAGHLTDTEFAQQKAVLLGSSGPTPPGPTPPGPIT
jgi:membrane protein YdbS with pleckstrin-like domain